MCGVAMDMDKVLPSLTLTVSLITIHKGHAMNGGTPDERLPFLNPRFPKV